MVVNAVVARELSGVGHLFAKIAALAANKPLATTLVAAELNSPLKVNGWRKVGRVGGVRMVVAFQEECREVGEVITKIGGGG